MSQINSNTKDDFQVVLLLSCFVGHPVHNTRGGVYRRGGGLRDYPLEFKKKVKLPIEKILCTPLSLYTSSFTNAVQFKYRHLHFKCKDSECTVYAHYIDFY